jgi:hypothetical protein
MKFLSALLVFFISATAYAQTGVNDYQVTLNGIGPFKVDMSKAEVEKIFNQSIQTPHCLKKDDNLNDTVTLKYKEAEITFVFYNRYVDEHKNEIAVYSISGKSPLLKTKSGVTIGDDKLKIISIYNDYSMNIYKGYDQDENGEYKPSKTKWIIQLLGESSTNVLEFKLENNRLVEFTVSIFEGC